MADIIIPSLWFQSDEGGMQSIVDYYKAVFKYDLKVESISPLGDGPKGKSEMVQIQLMNKPYTWMCTSEEHHPFNDSISLVLPCANQAEIDHYWDYFTKEGAESQCGWCQDKYGLRWQIIPENLSELLARPNGSDIMLKQKKIIIKEYA